MIYVSKIDGKNCFFYNIDNSGSSEELAGMVKNFPVSFKINSVKYIIEYWFNRKIYMSNGS